MNKTVSITLSGLAFTVEEDAYPLLREYLDAVARHFAGFDYGREVADDIEARLAERFSKKLTDTKTLVLSRADVEAVIAEIGTIEQLSGDEPETATASTSETRGRRRLYRNPDDALIAGVASGIAAYLGWDTTLVRVLFFVFLCLGWGIAVYLVLWLLVPEATTAAEKMEMRGSPLTMADIEKAAREKAEYIKSEHFKTTTQASSKRFFDRLLAILGSVVVFLAAFIRLIAGIAVTVAASVGAIATVFMAANLFVNRQSPYLDQTITGVFQGTEYYLVVALAFLTIFIPLIFLILAGVSLLKKQTAFSGALSMALVAVWMAALIGTGVLLINKGPAIEQAAKEYQGETESRPLETLKDFDGIKTSGGYSVTVHKGEKYNVILSGSKRDLDETSVRVESGTLVLQHDYENDLPLCIFCRRDDVRVDITMPELKGVKVTGASTLNAQGFKASVFSAEVSGASQVDLKLEAEAFELKASGASQARLTVKSKKSTLTASGASRIEIQGTSTEVRAMLSGASRLVARELQSEQVSIEAGGASHSALNASRSISVDLSGASVLERYGDGKLTIIEQSGSSEIIEK